MWVVSEFGEHPGTEHDTQAGQAGVDLSVRVPAKTLAEHLLQLRDLPGQRLQEPGLGGGDGGVGGLDCRRLTQRRSAQRRLDRLGAGIDVAPSMTLEDGCDLRSGQLPSPLGIGGAFEQFTGFGVAQVQAGRGQGIEQTRVILAQRLAQPLPVAGPIPDQGLVGARDQFQAFDLAGVPGDGTVVVAVEPDDLGEHMRITRIGLRPRGGVAFAVTGHRHRVDREDPIAGRDQRGHPRAAVGLDPDHHSLRREHPGLGIEIGVVKVFGEHLV